MGSGMEGIMSRKLWWRVEPVTPRPGEDAGVHDGNATWRRFFGEANHWARSMRRRVRVMVIEP